MLLLGSLSMPLITSLKASAVWSMAGLAPDFARTRKRTAFKVSLMFAGLSYHNREIILFTIDPYYGNLNYIP